MFRNTFPGEVLVHKQGWFNGLIPETKQGFWEFHKVSGQGEVWTECLYQWVRTPQTDIYDFDVAQALVLIWNLLFLLLPNYDYFLTKFKDISRWEESFEDE